MDHVIIVDANDNELGTMEKMEAHKAGKLHRAFSIFVVNSRGNMLIQKRADGKYHSGGLWSNTCCGHQGPGESLDESAHRRLNEEMGFDCELKELFAIIYRADLDNNIIEHEIDHVIIGVYDKDPHPDPAEVSAFSWTDPNQLVEDMRRNPERYTYWFRLLLERVIGGLSNGYLKKKRARF
ncbi:MAG TPA: isopentenyl-diphosphate Delta-isomerase [Spirochaetota bacterium]|nr:isopentenyl-diphosphate Delta-isomerase [Spirochaetota bacterium]HPC42658.1 isopentenyl-diphosphate Delta-isomerase [Spirochaetota bacterium]HPL16247.1 isopentenyl-diphosphate Delta-isomerase [Spirochaetota bacterium]HQF08422.1 isopentenyl-diphosphate Delta-isomerase [Spirochaetota bacterium]HQH99060.1 isopentenyl-diphosphate Delta-isomerase [Spirochaetota bacterium]